MNWSIRWRPATTLLGRARQWIQHRILGADSESCDRCGRLVEVAWWCSDNELFISVYRRSTGNQTHIHSAGYASGLLCVRCFDRAADALGRPQRFITQDLR